MTKKARKRQVFFFLLLFSFFFQSTKNVKKKNCDCYWPGYARASEQNHQLDGVQLSKTIGRCASDYGACHGPGIFWSWFSDTSWIYYISRIHQDSNFHIQITIYRDGSSLYPRRTRTWAAWARGNETSVLKFPYLPLPTNCHRDSSDHTGHCSTSGHNARL